MIAGYHHRRLEERINSALLSGVPYEYEIPFLQRMSERLIRRGRDAWLSDRQAQWLNAILDRCEAGKRPSAKPPTRPPAAPKRSKQLKSDFAQKTINLSDCMETTEVTSDSSSLLNGYSPANSSPPAVALSTPLIPPWE